MSGMRARAAVAAPLRRAWLVQRLFSSAKPPATSRPNLPAKKDRASNEVGRNREGFEAPAVYSAPPQGALQRRDTIEAMIIPRDQEEPILGKARSYLTNSLALVMFVLLAMMFKASRKDHTAEVLLMNEVAQDLRQRRVVAKQRLLACAEDSGEIPISRDKKLRWWATGPRDAATVILLATDDRENAVVWGHVHATLAERLGSNSAGANAPASTDSGHPGSRQDVRIVTYDIHSLSSSLQPTPESLLEHRALTLKVSDVDRVVQAAACGAGRAAAWWKFWAPAPAPPKVLLVHSGRSCWAGLAYAGLHPDTTLGAVLLQPQVHERSKYTVWMDAVPAASTVQQEGEGGDIVQKLLDAPAMPPGSLPPDTIARMDDRDPRTKALLQYYREFGMPGYTEALGKRQAEEMRRYRARQNVLTTLEQHMVDAVAPAAAAPSHGERMQHSPQHVPRIEALTVAPDALPGWLTDSAKRAVQHMYLVACNNLGLSLSSPPVRAALMQERVDTANLVKAELSGGIPVLEVKESKAPQSAGMALTDNTALADALEAAQLQHGWSRLPYALGIAGEPAVEDTFAYLQAQREFRNTPSNFAVTMVGQAAQTKDAAPSNGIVCLPLQCPEAVVERVLAVLHPAHPPRPVGGQGPQGVPRRFQRELCTGSAGCGE